jgi:hypothetical protein
MRGSYDSARVMDRLPWVQLRAPPLRIIWLFGAFALTVLGVNEVIS